MNRQQIQLAARAMAIYEQQAKLPVSTWQPQWLRSPLKLAARRLGKMRLLHRVCEPGEVLDIVSVREALLSNTKPASIKLTEQLIIHQLEEEGVGQWMTDLPNLVEEV